MTPRDRAGTVLCENKTVRKRTIISGLWGLALIPFALTAMGGQKFPDYPLRPAGDYAISIRQDEVTVGLDPVEKEEQQLTYFHIALSPRGFLPIFVVIHNESKTDSLLIDKSGVSYSTDLSGSDGPAENTASQKAGIVTTSAIPWIGAFLAAGIAQDQSEVKQNLILRELQSRTLGPGETMHGFLYVSVPKKGPRGTLRVEIPVAWSGSNQTSVVNLSF